MSPTTALLLAGLAALPAAETPRPGPVASGWSRVRSAHFEVLTDAGEPLGRHVAERLEARREMLRRLLPPRSEGERGIVVVALASRDLFERLVPRRHRRAREVGGFFQSGGERDTLVALVSVDERGPFVNVEHEYAHVALNRSLPAQPVWVAEGLAELLSDAVVEEGRARVGARLREHEERVGEEPGSLALLLAMRHDSPDYLGGTGGDLLYARSWALARWVVARRGLEGLRSLLEAVAEGEDPVAAFEGHLSPLGPVEATLLDVPPGPVLDFALDLPPPSAIEADAPPPADVEQRLGDLLLHQGETSRARVHLERALALDPGHVAARTSLSELYLRRGEWTEARRELRRAALAAPDDPAVLLREAGLVVSEARAIGEPLAPAVEARLAAQLERALAVAPGLAEAAMLLAELRPEPAARRLAALVPVFEQDPGRTDLARVIAALHMKRRDVRSARRVLVRARDAARDPAHRFLCDHLLAQIADYTAATREVRGRLLHVDCRADGSLRFSVEAEDGILRLEAPSARAFLVYGDGEASGEREIACGAQRRPLVVRYRRSETGASGVDGTVLWLDFLVASR